MTKRRVGSPKVGDRVTVRVAGRPVPAEVVDTFGTAGHRKIVIRVLSRDLDSDGDDDFTMYVAPGRVSEQRELV